MAWHLPPIGARFPRRGNAFSAFIGRTALQMAGWRFEGELPDVPKVLFVVAPHTSNWDFILAVAVMFALRIRVNFLGKHTLFRWPLGGFMRWVGGSPVYRHSPQNAVEQTVEHVRRSDRIALALSPEGTRRKRQAWRSGFHYVARGAEIPILPAAIDYSTRTIRFFPLYQAAETVEADLATLGALFHSGMARHPAQY